MKTERIEWIVSLRAIAAIAIVLLHVVSGWVATTGGGGWNLLTGPRLVLDRFIVFFCTRWAVPCFIMISGFLLLDPQKQFGLDKMLRYVLRMVAVLLTFGLFYCIVESTVSMGVSNPVAVFLISFKNLIEGKSWDHMWYVYMVIGLYLLTPMLRIFVRVADRRTAHVTLAVLFAFTIFRPTVNSLCGVNIFGIGEAFPIATPFLFYYLAGYYLRDVRWSKVTCAALFLLGICGMTVTLLLEKRGFPEIPSNENGFIAIYSIAVFRLAMNSTALRRMAKGKVLQRISVYSFGIYLIHPVFLNALNKGLRVFPDILPVGVGEFVFFIGALAGSFATTWVLCRIKPIRKILA